MAASNSDPFVRYYPYYSATESGEFTSRGSDYDESRGEEDNLLRRPKPRPGTPLSTEVLVPFGRARAYTDTRHSHSFIKTDIILRITARFAYGLLPCWPKRVNRCLFTASALIILLQLLAFGEYIYCVQAYWWTNVTTTSNWTTISKNGTSTHSTPRIPTVTLIMEVGLFISGIVSFILACRYFYSDNQNFDTSHCELIPQVDFGLIYEEGYVGPTPRDWLIANTCLAVAFLNIFFVILIDFQWNAYFDFYGIHDFLDRIKHYEAILYFAYIAIFVWGLASAVVSCCVFHILTRDIIQHITATEKHLLTSRIDTYFKARDLHEDLLKYREKLIEKFRVWFTTHNILFFFILLCMIFNWFEATSSQQVDEHKVLWASQLLASLLIAFKFSFPFISASRVTARFEEMYYIINRQKMFPDIRDLPKFLDYAERCNYGFVVFGFKITTNIALITILTTFVGIFKFLAN